MTSDQSVLTSQAVIGAFPAALAVDVTAMLSSTHLVAAHAASGGYTVSVGGEALTIPERVYFQPEALDQLGRLPRVQALVLAAIFTRHHDGHVRERALRAILSASEPWVPAYVVRLVGEYVIEILDLVEEHLPHVNLDLYSSFLAANPAFLELTSRRVMSYWDCYHRQRFPDPRGYVGFRVLAAFGGVGQRANIAAPSTVA